MSEVIRPPLALFEPSEAFDPSPEVVLVENASPLDFLGAVYRDPGQPMHRRMRAAVEALPFVHPKLAITATLDGSGFAAKLEAATVRSGRSFIIDGHKVIDAEATEVCRSSCD